MHVQNMPSIVCVAMLAICLVGRADDAVSAKKSAEPRLKVGATVPEFNVSLPSAEGVGFERLEKSHKELFVLVFWSHQDRDRAEAIKVMSQLRRQFRNDKRFVMLSCCLDGEWEDWLKWMDEQTKLDVKKEWPNGFGSDSVWWHAYSLEDMSDGFDKQSTLAPFELSSTPRLFVVGKNRKLIARDIKYDDLSKIVEKQLKQDAGQ